MKTECIVMFLAFVVFVSWVCLRPLFWLFYEDWRDNRAIKRENRRLNRRLRRRDEHKQ